VSGRQTERETGKEMGFVSWDGHAQHVHSQKREEQRPPPVGKQFRLFEVEKLHRGEPREEEETEPCEEEETD